MDFVHDDKPWIRNSRAGRPRLWLATVGRKTPKRKALLGIKSSCNYTPSKLCGTIPYWVINLPYKYLSEQKDEEPTRLKRKRLVLTSSLDKRPPPAAMDLLSLPIDAVDAPIQVDDFLLDKQEISAVRVCNISIQDSIPTTDIDVATSAPINIEPVETWLGHPSLLLLFVIWENHVLNSLEFVWVFPYRSRKFVKEICYCRCILITMNFSRGER